MQLVIVGVRCGLCLPNHHLEESKSFPPGEKKTYSLLFLNSSIFVVKRDKCLSLKKEGKKKGFIMILLKVCWGISYHLNVSLQFVW